MAQLICPKCRKRFSAGKALGGGWQGTRKVLGCPQCRTFFIRTPYVDLLGLVLGVANLLFAGLNVIYQSLAFGNNGRLLNGGLALLIGAWLILGNLYLFKKNVRGDAAIYTPPWDGA